MNRLMFSTIMLLMIKIYLDNKILNDIWTKHL